jgi:hypothetical protein
VPANFALKTWGFTHGLLGNQQNYFHDRTELMKQLFLSLLLGISCFAADVTGNWVVESPRNDGTVQKSYFNLKQEGDRISGSIRVTQFYYTIAESSGNSDNFRITGTMKDGKNERHVVYEGKLVGDDLHLSTRRRPDAPLTESVAHRTRAGEGAVPPRIAPSCPRQRLGENSADGLEQLELLQEPGR